ncbi:hypothetical protein SAMN02799616_00368 [Paenibacillus sp. UNC499MF]|nr:hypothetical protein SAMN02799616_00368 [Paenibacillus sp. UNC499MF]
MWVLFAFMLLNTAGNLTSISGPEKLFMTPLTVVLALLSLRLAVEKIGGRKAATFIKRKEERRWNAGNIRR